VHGFRESVGVLPKNLEKGSAILNIEPAMREKYVAAESALRDPLFFNPHR